MIGHVISGRYVVEAVVGTGGMAVVYRAFDRVKKQTVAIKVLRPEYESDSEFVHRFSREAVAASKVSHENIVNMYDVGKDGDIRYIVMEFVDGQTLKQMICSQGRIHPDQALRMAIRILAAVDHAHRNGIVHRDIKPQNILVDKQGHVKVADFGIARLKTSQTTRVDGANDGSALGSVHYFSPEQARGEVADEKSDLYSVGVVLYEMLTGQVPFDGENSVSVALKHVQEPPKSMRLYQNGISKALDEVVMRALCKDTTQRYQTAAEMAADLRKTINHPRGGFVRYPGQTDGTPAVTDGRRRTPKNRRKAIRTAAIAVVLLSVTAMLVTGWYVFGVRGRVVMPKLFGQMKTAAMMMMDDAGLKVTVENVYSEEYEQGMVIGQSVEEGERVRVGSNVTVQVSAGTRWFYMDDFIGKTEQEAVAILIANGAKNYTVEYVQNSDREVGTVIAQSMEAGYQSKEENVVLTVSGESVRMPPLTGLTVEGARALLESEGLKLGEVIDGYSADAPANTVIAQSVAPDAQVLAGTAVNLTVSRRQEAMYYPESRFTVTVPLENLEVQVTLLSPGGVERVAFDANLPMGTYPVELNSEEPGIHKVSVYLDGVLMEMVELMFR